MLFWLLEVFNESFSLKSCEKYSQIRVEQTLLFITFLAGSHSAAVLNPSLLPGVAQSSSFACDISCCIHIGQCSSCSHLIKAGPFDAVGTILYAKNAMIWLQLKHNEVMHVCSFSAQKTW